MGVFSVNFAFLLTYFLPRKIFDNPKMGGSNYSIPISRDAIEIRLVIGLELRIWLADG